MATLYLPAPWVQGTTTEAEVDVYTPPGYSASRQSYPVLYEAPLGYVPWGIYVSIMTQLDNLIDSGFIPPIIVVFATTVGSPHSYTECADSVDGLEWFETYLVSKVVPWIDTHYRTIASQPARGLMGMSEGGYCAAILLLRQPEVFGTAISFSGYYQAGANSANATRIFGTDPAVLAEHAPLSEAAQLPASLRSRLAFVLVAQRVQPFYGDQEVAFEKVLDDFDYPYVVIDSELQHGYPQASATLGQALVDWSSRLAMLVYPPSIKPYG